MDCRRVRKSLEEYVRGGLDQARRDEVARHLESCEGCARLAEKLSLSASALSTLAPVKMPEEASRRILAGLLSPGTARFGVGFLHSSRALATAGVAAASLLALTILLVIMVPGGPAKKTQLSQKAQQTMAAGTQGESTQAEAVQPANAEIPLPVVKLTENDYSSDSIRNMAENLDIKRQFAERYSLDDAINLRVAYIRKIADEFVSAGGDGPMLETMIRFIEKTEPVMLPCYAEQALFSGRTVIIIGLCGPPRGGTSRQLIRTEFWAFDPGTFPTSPDDSLVWWGQSLKQ